MMDASPRRTRVQNQTHPGHYVREWRKYRGLTQERLAEMIGTSHGQIGQLERGETGYHQDTFELIADALRCTPADLIDRLPNDTERPWQILNSMDGGTRRKAVEMLKLLAGQDPAPQSPAE